MPGHDSPSLPISTSGVPIAPSGNPMSGPRPTSAGSCWRGIRLSGRLVDSADRPIAGQTINAYSLKGRDRHSTTTEADGTFALGPLRPANYLIYGEGQSPYFDWELDAAAPARPIRVVQPARLFLKEKASPEPLVLRELPTVRVELRFVDSKGKPTRGSTTRLWGLLPEDPHPPGVFPLPAYAMREGTTSALNAPEREVRWEPTSWGMEGEPDDDGRTVFYAPQGLKRASVGLRPEEETTAFKHRIDPKGPILPVPPVRLDLLRKRRKPPGAGQTAPPFAVTTIEGQALSLASLHGKTVLLHFWRPLQGIGIPDAATLLAIHERFGSNKRFTMVGLCVSDRSEEATRAIQSAGLSWSQAMLRDGWYDTLVINYGVLQLQPDATFLIGPDGKLITRSLQGTALEKAVAEALAGK